MWFKTELQKKHVIISVDKEAGTVICLHCGLKEAYIASSSKDVWKCPIHIEEAVERARWFALVT